jgi:tetratricopeptide (TPR) repeat protein
MATRWTLLAVATVCVSAAQVWAQGAAKGPCYVILKGQTARQTGQDLTAEPDGTLTLVIDRDKGISQKFRRNQVQFAFKPSPEVDMFVKAYESARYDVVLKNAQAMFEKYKFLGWGDYIAYLEGMCHVQAGKFDVAMQCFDRGAQFEGLYAMHLRKGRIQALIGLKRNEEAKRELDVLMRSPDNATAAFAFNMRGRILAEQGKKREAVLEYMKTILVIGREAGGDTLAEAKKQATALLTEMNHPRAKDIDKL